ncbi:MAG: alkaline phosphatase family protein [Candidatus Omnitrophica bacterium]|nr:alkaline phosphatase family protein [Candidatus Omnitrophota bacterium]
MSARIGWILLCLGFLSILGLSVCDTVRAESKVIILGFDGASPELCQKWMDEGWLPNLSRLAGQGSFTPLGTVTPPQSPVSWAAFSAGANPGKTGIFDFLRRMPGSYYPEFGMAGRRARPILPKPLQRILICLFVGGVCGGLLWILFRGMRLPWAKTVGIILGFGLSVTLFAALTAWVPASLPWPESNKQSRSFWQIAAEAGVSSVVIQCPVTFPAEPMRKGFGRLLSGLGVPDVRGTMGTFSYYSDKLDKNADTEMGGKLIQVVPDTSGQINTFVWGPRNETLPDRPPVKPPLVIQLDREENQVTLRVGKQSQTLKAGSWSDWFEFVFVMNPLLKVEGIGRFYVKQVSPDFELYLSPINFDPRHTPPNVNISFPRRFSRELAKRVGLYKTLGWSNDTWALNEEKTDENIFVQDAYFTLYAREAIMMDQLAREDWRLFVGVFEVTDRLQHMFWRLIDTEHPMYDEELARVYGSTIRDFYIEMDRIVGKVMKEYVDEDTWLAVISDHGFKTFRTAVNINTFLAEKGYIRQDEAKAAKDKNLDDLFDKGQFWTDVDWSRTRAYCMGLAGVYVNLQGREPQGIVPVEEYDAVCESLIRDLKSLTDPTSGQPIVRSVYRKHEVYHGPSTYYAPDLIVGFEEGYRTSWQTALGGIPPEVLGTNMRKWSGDHCSFDAPIIPGVLFSNRWVETVRPSIMDMAPTALHLLGVETPREMDGRILKLGSPSG